MKRIVIFLLLIGVVFAQTEGYIESVSVSSSVSTATTGTSFQITTVITAGGSQTTANQIQLISIGTNGGGTFSISDPPTGSYSNVPVSTSGTTKTFTATAGVADTYTYYVTATYSGGSKSSTSQVIEFIDPDTLIVSGSPSNAGSKNAGDSYTLSINIQNPTSKNVVTSYSLSCPSGISCTGDPLSSSGTTITKGTTKSLQWTVSIDNDFSGTKTVVFALGDNTNAFTSTITGAGITTTTIISGGGGGGGAAGVTTTTTTTIKPIIEQIKKWTSMIPNVLYRMLVTEEMALKQIKLMVKNAISNAEIMVKKRENPSVPVPSGVVYQYIEIKAVNLTSNDIETAEIEFSVEKSWLENNNLDKNTVTLQRYSNGWQELETSLEKEFDATIRYKAEVPGFSIFAITANPIKTTTTILTEKTTTTTVKTKPKEDWTSWIVMLLIIVLIGIGGYLFYHYEHAKKVIKNISSKR